MSNRDIYRQRAQDCLLTAAICKSPERKVFLTAMAHAWHRLAQPQHIAEAAGQQARTRREDWREEEAALATETDAVRTPDVRRYRARG